MYDDLELKTETTPYDNDIFLCTEEKLKVKDQFFRSDRVSKKDRFSVLHNNMYIY